MAHHRHFVQRRLSVEHNNVSITHVPLDLEREKQVTNILVATYTPLFDEPLQQTVKTNFVSYLKVKVTWFRVESQVNSVPIVSDDIFGSRVLTVTSPHKLLKSVKREKMN